MSPRWLAVGAVLLAVLGLGPTFSPPVSANVEPTAAAWVAPALGSHLPDTLRTNATTDAPLILSLPAELGGAPVSRYTVLRGPALCGVAGRSFTWVAPGTDPGTYDIRLHAHHADVQPDTLVVQITLTQ